MKERTKRTLVMLLAALLVFMLPLCSFAALCVDGSSAYIPEEPIPPKAIWCERGNGFLYISPGAICVDLREYYKNEKEFYIYDTEGGQIGGNDPVENGAAVRFGWGENALCRVIALGDVDGEFGITASDARAVLRCAVGLEPFEEGSYALLACDADRDGEITAADARTVLRLVVGLDDHTVFEG